MRKTERYPVEGANSLWHVYKTVPFWKVIKNFIVIQLARYSPFLGLKNWLVSDIFTDENWGSNVICPYGHARYYVSREN